MSNLFDLKYRPLKLLFQNILSLYSRSYHIHSKQITNDSDSQIQTWIPILTIIYVYEIR